MSTKPIFQGTYEQYMDLPPVFRDEYAAPQKTVVTQQTPTPQPSQTKITPKNQQIEITPQTIQYLALQDYGQQFKPIRKEYETQRQAATKEATQRQQIANQVISVQNLGESFKEYKEQTKSAPKTVSEKQSQAQDTSQNFVFGPRAVLERNMVNAMGPSSNINITGSLLDLSGKSKEIGLKTTLRKRSDQIDFLAGAVGSVESLVNPKVDSATTALLSGDFDQFQKKYSKSYVAGSVFGEALAIKGIGTAGKAVGLTAKGLALGAGINVAVSQGISYGTTGKFISARESRSIAYAGAGEAIIGTAAIAGLAKSGNLGSKIAKNLAGRAVVEGAVDAGLEGVYSGGDPEAMARGFVVGSAFSAVGDIGSIAVSKARTKLPKGLGGVESIEASGKTIGMKGQEIDVYTSKNPIKELDNKKIRVIPDVTEKPAGFDGVTTKSIIGDYTGKKVTTAHATLVGDKFSLKEGGETLLEGFPGQSKGFRKTKELYPFYSAPSTKDVTVYGGYAGIGEAYGSDAKVVIGKNKPTVLVTTDTEISSSYLKNQSESLDDYLDRVTKISGKSGVAPETVLGKSPERQVVTPTSYTRKGEQLPGSVFVSEGKIGTFQIKTKGKGFLDLPTYTNLDVVKGRFEAASGVNAGKTVDLKSYSSSYRKTISVSTPSTVLSPIFGVSSGKTKSGQSSQVSQVKSSSGSTFKSTGSFSSKPINVSEFNYSSPTISTPKLPSLPSYPSKPSMPSSPFVPSIPDYPSFPDYPNEISDPSYPPPPSYPDKPSVPRYPPPPSYPSDPSVPNYPSSPGKPYRPFMIIGLPEDKNKKGKIGLKYKKILHPVLTPKQVRSQLVFGKGGKKNKSLVI